MPPGSAARSKIINRSIHDVKDRRTNTINILKKLFFGSQHDVIINLLKYFVRQAVSLSFFKSLSA